MGKELVTSESEEPNMAAFETPTIPSDDCGEDRGSRAGDDGRRGATVPNVIGGEATVHWSSMTVVGE